MNLPSSWSHERVRYKFFSHLPRPLAVMLACDVASLAPQPPVGVAAIDAARRWIMGAAEPSDVRRAARAAAYFAPTTTHPAYAAAAAANTVHTPVAYLAYSAAAVCQAVNDCVRVLQLDKDLVGYQAQSRRVEFLQQAIEEEQVRLLIEANRDDPAARPILWDAMLDAGYTPQPTRPWVSDSNVETTT